MKELVLLTTCDLCTNQYQDEAEAPSMTFDLGYGLVYELEVCRSCREDRFGNMKMSKLIELSREVTSLHKNTGKKNKSPKEPCPDCGKLISARGMTLHRKSHD